MLKVYKTINLNQIISHQIYNQIKHTIMLI